MVKGRVEVMVKVNLRVKVKVAVKVAAKVGVCLPGPQLPLRCPLAPAP